MKITKTIRATIKAIADRRDCDAIRITRAGEVHFRGVMPNTNQYGWFFAGDAASLLKEEGAC
jgi:hypothetical protein